MFESSGKVYLFIIQYKTPPACGQVGIVMFCFQDSRAGLLAARLMFSALIAGLAYPTRTLLSVAFRVHVVGLVSPVKVSYQNSQLDGICLCLAIPRTGSSFELVALGSCVPR